MADDETAKLLTEIRDLLADRDKRYDEYLANCDKRNADQYRAWTDRLRYWSFVFWVGTFAAVFAATVLAISLGK